MPNAQKTTDGAGDQAAGRASTIGASAICTIRAPATTVMAVAPIATQYGGVRSAGSQRVEQQPGGDEDPGGRRTGRRRPTRRRPRAGRARAGRRRRTGSSAAASTATDWLATTQMNQVPLARCERPGRSAGRAPPSRARRSRAPARRASRPRAAPGRRAWWPATAEPGAEHVGAGDEGEEAERPAPGRRGRRAARPRNATSRHAVSADEHGVGDDRQPQQRTDTASVGRLCIRSRRCRWPSPARSSRGCSVADGPASGARPTSGDAPRQYGAPILRHLRPPVPGSAGGLARRLR